jgi:hypothetical protein
MEKIKMKIVTSVMAASVIILSMYACNKDFLKKAPLGSLDPGNLSNSAGVQGLLIGAYSLLDGYGGANSGWESAASNWVYGSVASDDSYKGSDAGDQPDINPIETYTETASDYYFNNKWSLLMDGVSRSNDVLRTMRLAKDITPKDTLLISAQARFLRAHYHFEGKKMWNSFIFVDESINYAAGNFNVSNSTEILPAIEADLQYAIANLPPSWGSQAGRINVWGAKSYLAKVYMFEHKFQEAKTLLDDIIANGKTSKGTKYALTTNFEDNFNPALQNNSEGVFEVQNSVNDNSNGSNGNWGDVLNFPYGPPGGCCGFNQPSQSLVNSYRVDANGLPFLDTWNAVDVKNDQGLKSTDPFTTETSALDSRLDWTVGRRGIPYLDWGLHPGNDWIRDQNNGGPYSPIKNLYFKSQTGTLTDNNFWTPGVTANNYMIIRFADVLLWAAECEVEIGSLDKAKDYVNMVRARAANPVGWVKKADGTPAANYNVGLYPSFANQDYARKAVRFERKIELAMEGQRFFDLQRYSIDPKASYANNGYMADVLNAYIAKEKGKRTYLQGKTFTKSKNEYFPIPQAQIDLEHGALKQNSGY